jgi:hypothetical protein
LLAEIGKKYDVEFQAAENPEVEEQRAEAESNDGSKN